MTTSNGQFEQSDHVYVVNALWDDVHNIWHSESNVPGLVIETRTLDEFRKVMKDLAPEVLSLRRHLQGKRVKISFVVSEVQEYSIS
jgi:hypothetical protein